MATEEPSARVVSVKITAEDEGVASLRGGPATGEPEVQARVVWPGQSVPLRSYSYFSQPRFKHSSRRRVFNELVYKAEPLVLYSLHGARLFGSPLFASLSDGRIVRETFSHWHPREAPEGDALLSLIAKKARSAAKAVLQNYRQLGEAGARRVTGPCLLLASYYDDNYYHWHVDLLPTLELWAQVSDLKDVKILIGRDAEYIRKSLAYYGIGEEQIIRITETEPLEFEQLVFASTIETADFLLHPQVGDVFRTIARAAPKGKSGRGRKIFVSRGGAQRRLLINRAAVEARFEAQGFHVVDPGTLTYEEQIRLFHDASVIVGEHGGGLGNIGFCQPGTLVVELFHPTFNALCYLSLAEVQRLRHQIFLGEEAAQTTDVGEWSVDPDAAWAFVDDCLVKHAATIDARLP